jgi:hypothetical protein
LQSAAGIEVNPLPASPLRPKDRLVFWMVALFIALLQAWSHRNEFPPDSISYAEIAWAVARSGLSHLVNGYWSPLYPFLLSLEFRFFPPSPQFEFAAAHLFNFLLFIASLACFELLLKELVLARRAHSELPTESVAASERALWLWGCVLFLWATQFWLGPSVATPDLCVAALVYLATALLFRIRRGGNSWLVFLALGALLGLSYLAKAAMFFIAPVFLFSAFSLGRSSGLSLRASALRTLLATVVFSILALPFIFALSAQKGRPTIGDVGRIAYAEYVNRAILFTHWQGEPPGTGTPAHPTRKVLSDPAIFEFATPVPGSYPPWHDPSYWYEGIRPSFSLKNQLWAMFRSANAYLRFISKSGALWLLLAALWYFWKKMFCWGRLAPGTWFVLLPSAVTLAMYEMVHVEIRYVAPFALILLLSVLAKVGFKELVSPKQATRVRLIVVLAPAFAIAWSVARDLSQLIHNAPDENWVVARHLHDLGISPGTRIATLGSGSNAAWAHLAGARVIAEIPDQELPRFIAADDERKRQILALISSLGAASVVTRNPAVAGTSEGWRPIPGTHFFIWLPPTPAEPAHKK